MVGVFTGPAVVPAVSRCQDEGLILEFAFMFVAVLTWQGHGYPSPCGFAHEACVNGYKGTWVFLSSYSTLMSPCGLPGPVHLLTNCFLSPAQCQALSQEPRTQHSPLPDGAHRLMGDPAGNQIAAHKCKNPAVKRLTVLPEGPNKGVTLMARSGETSLRG